MAISFAAAIESQVSPACTVYGVLLQVAFGGAIVVVVGAIGAVVGGFV